MKQSLASIPGPLRYSRASGSVVLRCVWLERFSPRKSDGAPLPSSPPTGGSFGLKLFIEAQASISVPSTEKCSLDSSRSIRGSQHSDQEPGRDLAFEQPVAVLRKGRVIPHRIVDAEPDEPPEQQIELQPLHQLPLRSDRIKCLQQHRSQQHLGGNRRPPQPGIERREIARQRRESRIRQSPDGAQRMVGPHPLLKINVRKQLPQTFVWSPHRSPRRISLIERIMPRPPMPSTSSTAC